jgi:ribose/xylose/arabinose/galactoside ABC-type transport system permease subunit
MTELKAVAGPQPSYWARTELGRRVLLSLRSVVGIYSALGVLIIVVAFLEPTLISQKELTLTLRQVSVIGLLAVGQTLVMLTGGIDLSVGSIVAVVNWVSASVIAGDNGRTPQGILICLSIALAIGFINGIGVALFRVPPFVMTLGTLFAVVAAGQWYTNGVTTGAASTFLIHLGQDSIGIFPIAFLIFAGAAVIAQLLLVLTPYGRRVYAIGANPRAAHLAGVNSSRVLVITYMLSGLTAGIGGLLLTGYIEGGATTSGRGAELEAIAAVVIGGTALSGGRGNVIASMGGVLFLGLLFNLLVVLDIEQSGRFMVQGFALIMAGAIYSRTLARR